MGKDSQGRERGGCNLCESLEFEREEVKIEIKAKTEINYVSCKFHGALMELFPLGFFLNYCVGVLHNLWGCF